MHSFIVIKSLTPLYYSSRLPLLRVQVSSTSSPCRFIKPAFFSSSCNFSRQPDFFYASECGTFMEVVKAVARQGSASCKSIAIRADQKSYSYNQLISSAWRISRILCDAGLKTDDGIKGNEHLGGARIGIVAKPCAEFIAGILGTWFSGGVAVPLALSYPEAELLHVINDSDVSMILSTEDHQVLMQNVAAKTAAQFSLIPPVPSIPSQTIKHDLSQTGEIDDGIFPGNGNSNEIEEDPALIIYTSGTTGKPKGAVHTHKSILAQFVMAIANPSRCAKRRHCWKTFSRCAGPLTHYLSLVEQGKLQHDPFQEKVALELENLVRRLEQYEKEMEEYQVKLAKWEENRENERRKRLMEEAEVKQQGSVTTSESKHKNRFFERWISRRKPETIEPGVGKWVSYLNRERKLDSLVGHRPTAPPAPKGLYLYGNVGSGKTMLMDMFYSATEGIVKHRRRFHFHEAMLLIHEHMHKIWKNQVEEKSLQSSISSWIMNLPFDKKVKEWVVAEERYRQELQMKNILPAVADEFLVDHNGDRGASILCFDEIQTVDVFAVVALSGIVSRLLSTGTVLVATSNRAPRDLNQDGMQREIFLKLVAKLEEHCENVLIGSDIDYRRLIAQRSIDQVHYFWPLDKVAQLEFEKMWDEITGQSGGRLTSKTLRVMFGRTLEVPDSCNGVARFSFEYLCGQAVGAADYIAVAKSYHTVFISNIPVMSMRIRDKARRFITLVDELYNHHCCLFCSAASAIDDLFQGTEEGPLFDLESFQFETEIEGGKLRRNVLAEGNVGSGGSPVGIISLLSGQEEMFAFRRAVSRLIEMQTPLYLEGVRHLHPYFQIQRKGIADDGSTILQA